MKPNLASAKPHFSPEALRLSVPDFFYYVSDLDGLWASTPQELLKSANHQLGLRLNMRHYQENLPEMLGLPFDEALRFLRSFYSERMPNLGLMYGAQRTKRVIASHAIVMDIWTTRRAETIEMTRTWIQDKMALPTGRSAVRDVLHVPVPWGSEGAHLRTKGEYLLQLPHRPHLFADDELKHVLSVAAHGIQSVLYGNRPGNREAIVPDNVVKLPNQALLREYLEEQAAAYEQAA